MSDTIGGYSNPEIAALRRTLKPATSIAFAFGPDFAKREPARAFLYREISALTLGDNQPNATAAPATQSDPTTAMGPDIRPVLDKKIPVLFIVGEQDAINPPPIIEAMHKEMAGSQLVKVPGAGHSVYFEKPDDYNRIVMDFLQQHARVAATSG